MSKLSVICNDEKGLMKLKIIMVSKSAFYELHGIGGLQDHVFLLTNELCKLGYIIFLIVAGDKSEGPISGAIYGLNENCQIYFISQKHNSKSTRYWRDEVCNLVKTIHSNHKVNLIHSHAGAGFAIAKRNIDTQLRIPFVITFHSTTFSMVLSELRCIKYCKSYKQKIKYFGIALTRSINHFALGLHNIYRGRHVITPSKIIAKRVAIENNIDRKNIHIVYHGINDIDYKNTEDSRKNLRKKLGLSNEHFVLANLGRLAFEKGISIIIDVLPKLTERYPFVKFLIIGDGEMKNELNKLVKQVGIEDSVIFSGAVPPKKISMYIKSVDALLCTSIAEESFCLSALHGMFANKLVIVSNYGALPEVIGRNLHSGIVVDPLSANNLTEVLFDILEQQELNKHIGNNAGKRAMKYFSKQRMLDETIDVYKEIIKVPKNKIIIRKNY
jgi:glycosyltransferase involved in cell wall biosynthesis